MYTDNEIDPFWLLLKKETGGLPGQEKWIRRNATQWTDIINDDGDRIGIYSNNQKLLWMTITGSKSEQGKDLIPRMKRFSQVIIDRMSDQSLAGKNKTIEKMTKYQLEKCIENESNEGRTIRVQMEWNRDNQDGWPKATRWIGKQYTRLNDIASGSFE